MNNLLKLIQKYQTLLIFLLLQCFSFILIFRQNNFHHSSVLNSSNTMVGSVYSGINNISSFINLKEENEKLNAENAHLKTLLKGYSINEYNTFVVYNDTIKKQQYKIASAEVIQHFTKGRNNYLTLNVGSSNGVEPHMGVSNSEGIIGFTKDVSSHYSTVVPIIHTSFLTTVKHATSGSKGLLKWTEDNDVLNATVINLPKYININVNDKIVTQGYDGIFLPNEPIGVVEDIFTEAGSNYQTAIIKLNVDFNALQNVVVVKDLFKKEQKELEEKQEQ